MAGALPGFGPRLWYCLPAVPLTWHWQVVANRWVCFLGNFRGNTIVCLQSGHTRAAESGRHVNLVLPGTAGSAPPAARGLSRRRGHPVPSRGVSGEWLGAPEPKVGGWWERGARSPGLAPALHLKLRQIPCCEGKLSRSGRSSCAWKPAAVLLWVRGQRMALGRSKAPPCHCSAGLGLAGLGRGPSAEGPELPPGSGEPSPQPAAQTFLFVAARG